MFYFDSHRQFIHMQMYDAIYYDEHSAISFIQNQITVKTNVEDEDKWLPENQINSKNATLPHSDCKQYGK